MLEFLRELMKEPWRPVSRWVGAAWLIFYALFAIYAFSQHGGYLFIDSANLVVHEGGHLLFGWFGQTISLWGGTILQWLVAEDKRARRRKKQELASGGARSDNQPAIGQSPDSSVDQ